MKEKRAFFNANDRRDASRKAKNRPRTEKERICWCCRGVRANRFASAAESS